MKRGGIAVTILVGILVVSILNGLYFTAGAREAIGLLEKTQEAIVGEDWKEAAALAGQAEEGWMAADFYHHLVLSADILDQLAQDFQELRCFLSAQDGPEARAATAGLITRLELAAREEQCLPENFL